MSQYNNLPSTLMLTIWVLLCIILFTRDIDAGKGKVPIYMPIPIPIPMPMGPTGGGPKFNHHHQAQHQNDDEGEVKKIYLLQPMPKVQPPPQLKGGFVGPVQNHIHLPPSTVQHPSKYRSPSHSSYGGSPDNLENHHNNGGGSSGHKHQSDMKILPIVVIPPIAPMPPIHVPASNTNSHAPRMTLTPQFNNYVVSSGSEPSLKSKINHHRTTVSGYPQDDANFEDYGGTGLGSSEYRGSIKPRGRTLRARQIGRPSQTLKNYKSSASRYRPFRYEEQRDGDMEDLDDYEMRRQSQQQRGRRTGSSNRYRTYREPLNHRSRERNSIRDVIKQQTLFDDDQSYSVDGGSSGGDSMIRSSKQSGDCCTENLRARQQSSLQTLGETQVNANTEQREVSALLDRDYLDHKDQLIKSRYADIVDELEVAGIREKQSESLGNPYYERDLFDDELRQSTNHQSGSNPEIDVNGRRLYLDERKIMDDDQWLFDTVKSVSHVDPPTNTTLSKFTNEAVKLNATLNTNTKNS